MTLLSGIKIVSVESLMFTTYSFGLISALYIMRIQRRIVGHKMVEWLYKKEKADVLDGLNAFNTTRCMVRRWMQTGRVE